MKVFVAGATGVMGRQLIPRLIEAGHDVAGTTRAAAKGATLEELGAEVVVLDALDRDAVLRAVAEVEPDVIIHQLTAIGSVDVRRFDQSFAATNRLRTEGTDNLLAAGRAAGVRRFIAQSYAGWPYARVGGPIKSEEDPLDSTPAAGMRETLEAIRHLEDAVLRADWTDGLVLRYGGFYGPGTSMDAEGEQIAMIRARKFPVVGDGGGVWSFVHIADAAEATVAAVERGRPGVYNVVDDEPAPVSEWLPAVAERIGAAKPWHVPRWLGRLMAGEAGVVMMTEIRGATNEKAKRELGWQPRHGSWREALAG